MLCLSICPQAQFTSGGLIYYCQSMWVLYYILIGSIRFSNETMDVSMRQGNTQHRVNDLICPVRPQYLITHYIGLMFTCVH